MCSIGAHGYPDTHLLEQVIHCELHQDLIPEMRALHTVGGERLLGAVFQGRERVVWQRRPNLSQPPSPLPLVMLSAALLVISLYRSGGQDLSQAYVPPILRHVGVQEITSCCAEVSGDDSAALTAARAWSAVIPSAKRTQMASIPVRPTLAPQWISTRSPL
jgi:hypothetical protein